MSGPIAECQEFTLVTPTLMYIVVSDEAAFDAIDAPVLKYAMMKAKDGKWNGIEIIFQYFYLTTEEEIPF